MKIQGLKKVELLTITDRQKNPNGSYSDIYSTLDEYMVKIQELNDEISATTYGADIVNMLKIASPLKDLEKFLYTKVHNKEDNISKYRIKIDETEYTIKSVRMSGVDIERY